MSAMLISLLTLLLTAQVDDQATPAKKSARPPERYDVIEGYFRAQNYTVLVVYLGTVHFGRPGLITLNVNRVYEGKRQVGADAGPIQLRFTTARRGSVPTYKEDHAVRILADGQELKLVKVEYGSYVDRNMVHENFDVDLADDEARRLLAPIRRLDVVLGPVTLRLSSQRVLALREFAQLALDPRLPVKVPPLAPGATPRPDRTAIPKGQGIMRIGDGSRPCRIMLDPSAFDEIDELMAQPRRRPQDYLAKFDEIKQKGQVVEVASGTAVKILGMRERRPAGGSGRLMNVQVLDGPHKGLTGWCSEIQVLTSLKDPADRDAEEAEDLWREGQQFEKEGKPKFALSAYQDILKLLPNTPRAKPAAERIKAMKSK